MAGALKSLGLRNLRSLRLVDPIKLAPITILLGKNSVGKSTFARVFPLFRQSAERKKRSPVLWFGDLVDFGSLGSSVSEGESEVCFQFEVEIDLPARKGAMYGLLESGATRRKATAQVSLTLAETPTTKTGYAKQLTVRVLGSVIELNLPHEPSVATTIVVDGQSFAPPSAEHAVVAFQGDVLPLLYFYVQQKSATGILSWVAAPNHWDERPTQVIRNSVHQNTSTSTCRKIARQVPLGTLEQIRDALPTIAGPISWTTLVLGPGRDRVVRELHRTLILSHVGELLLQVDTALSEYFKGVRYLKPLRATAERYYRRLDLSVAEIDPDGSNLPIFLDSLPSYELGRFRSWLREKLDLDVFPLRAGDQVMVMAQGKNDAKAFNIADMGFGISQVLPIAAQLWFTTRPGHQTSTASMVVLEQPELHLHPDSQARLADLLAGAVQDRDGSTSNRPSVLVETHSQHLVNRLGQLIERGALKPTDVSVVLFEAVGPVAGSTSIRVAHFSGDGVLTNWPYGFFEPELA